MSRSIRMLSAGACVVVLLLGVTAARDGRAAGREAPLPPGLLENERNTIRVFRRVSDAVVFITNSQLRRSLFSLNVTEVPQGSGSGFVWDREGHVVTNFHVVQGGDSFQVTLADGTALRARLVGSEPSKDLAVLQIAVPEDGLSPLELGSSHDLVVGQKVLAVGNPFGLDHTLTTGVISALGREIPSVIGTTIRDVIQTDASINPGNSGGPLLDSKGRLIGINTAIYSPSGASAGIGFAVPVDTIRRIVPDLIAHGVVKRIGLGITVLSDHLSGRLAPSGVVVHRVEPNSPAARAGLQPLRTDLFGNVLGFDLLLELDGAPLHRYDDLFRALEGRRAGEEVTLRYARGSEERSVRLELVPLN